MRQIDLYCDECRQDLLVNKNAINDNNRYVCIGGMSVPREQRINLKKRIVELKRQYGINKEFKWGNVSSNRIDFYKALVDLFFDEEFLNVSFRCVVIDANKVDNKRYNDDDQELSYYKFYYQLIHNWLNKECSYFIFTDYKTNKEKDRLNELRRILNLNLLHNNVELIQALDSSESVILQMQNIIMGTVAYKYNYGDFGTSSAKKALMEYVEKRLKRSIGATYHSEHKFNVFEMKLGGGK